jgi:hypothetical protein
LVLVELTECIVPAGESEKYLLSDDSEDEDKKLDTVEEGQEEAAPVEETPSADSNADAEAGDSPEEAKDGGGDSIPEEASTPSADPEPPVQEEAEVLPPSEPEPPADSTPDQPAASEPPTELEANPVAEEVKEEAPAEPAPVEKVKEEEPAVEAPIEEPASEAPAPGMSSRQCQYREVAKLRPLTLDFLPHQYSHIAKLGNC